MMIDWALCHLPHFSCQLLRHWSSSTQELVSFPLSKLDASLGCSEAPGCIYVP